MNDRTNQRLAGTANQVAAANASYQANVDLFFALLEARRAVEGDEAIDRLLADIKERRCSIQAHQLFDMDGILSFAFYRVSPGAEPELVIDALPVREMQG